MTDDGLFTTVGALERSDEHVSSLIDAARD